MRLAAVSAAFLATSLMAAPAMAKTEFTVKGKLAGAPSGTTVMVVGSDGTSASKVVTKKGAFVIKSKGAVAKGLNPKKGIGATLHLLRDGKYVGPLILATKGSKGYGRFTTKLPAAVDLGTVKVSSKGYAQVKKAVKKKLLDTKRTMKLRKGVPLGAGTQGATGSLRTSAAVIAAEVLPKSADTLGSDADSDGVPNLADVDMNGDQVLDAAQADGAVNTESGPLDGKEVLEGRPVQHANFAKILNNDWEQRINSNRNPQIPWTALTAYLAQELQIEALIAPPDIRLLLCGSAEQTCAAAEAVAKVTMDCATLSYCQPGSPAVILGQPGSPTDRKPLSSLLDAQGRIVLPQDTHVPGTKVMETGFQLGFAPKVTGQDDLQFSGDSFEFTFYDANGKELARQARVLTSSVAAAPEWVSINGQPVASRLDMNSVVTIPKGQPLELSFVRPQRLSTDSGDAPQLIDRGGLAYKVYMYTADGGPNTFYWCRPSQVGSTSPEMANMIPGQQQMMPMMYDTNVNPVNGTVLSFKMNVDACLNDPMTPVAGPPADGTTLAVELESQDSDGNRTRTRIYVKQG